MVKSYPLICLVTFLLSVVNEAFRPANSTAIAHYSKEENRTRSYSLNRLAINLGWAVGGALGGILASIDYHLLFWTDGLTNIAAALSAEIFSDARFSYDRLRQKTEAKSTYLYLRLRIRVTLCLLASQFCLQFVFFSYLRTLPVYYKQSLHIKEFFIGLLMALNGFIIALVEMILIFKLEGKKQSVYFIRNGFLLTGISFLLTEYFTGFGDSCGILHGTGYDWRDAFIAIYEFILDIENYCR